MHDSITTMARSFLFCFSRGGGAAEIPWGHGGRDSGEGKRDQKYSSILRLGLMRPSHLEPASQRVVSRIARCEGVLGRSQRTWKINTLVWVPCHAPLPQDRLVSSVVRRKTVCRTLPPSSLRFPKKAKWSPKRGVWLWLVTRTPKFSLCLRGDPLSGKEAQGSTSACSSPRVAGLAEVFP